MASERGTGASRAAVSSTSFPSPAHDPVYRAAFGVREGEPFSSREERLVELRRIERAYAERTDELGRSLHRQAVARLRDAGEEGPVEVEGPVEAAGPEQPLAPIAEEEHELDPEPSADSDPLYRAAFDVDGPEVGSTLEDWLAELRRIAHDYAGRQDELGRRLHRQAVAALEQAGQAHGEDEAPARAAG